MNKILTLFFNLLRLRTFDPKVVRFLWNECDIKIFRYGIGNGAFRNYLLDSFYPPCIDIGKSISYVEKMTTLLHEVGHYKDYKLIPDKHLESFFNNDKRCEKSAWKHAVRFSDKYNIAINNKTSLNSIKSYGCSYRVLEKRAINER